MGWKDLKLGAECVYYNFIRLCLPFKIWCSFWGDSSSSLAVLNNKAHQPPDDLVYTPASITQSRLPYRGEAKSK